MNEDSGVIKIQIDRKFGAIGNHYVNSLTHYTVFFSSVKNDNLKNLQKFLGIFNQNNDCGHTLERVDFILFHPLAPQKRTIIIIIKKYLECTNMSKQLLQ